MHIKLNFKIFIIMFLFCISNQFYTYSITLVFIAIHEIAHIVAGVWLGYKITFTKIKLSGFDMIFVKENSNVKDNIKIAIAGPLSNVLSAIAFIFIPINVHLCAIIVYTNILLSIINLFPIYPLDGGRILKEILSIKYDTIKVIDIVDKITYISIIILTMYSSILILIYHNLAIIVGVVFLWYIAIKEHKRNIYLKIAYRTIKNYENYLQI